jgi:hypothetical protein
MPCYRLFLNPEISEYQWVDPDLFSSLARERENAPPMVRFDIPCEGPLE